MKAVTKEDAAALAREIFLGEAGRLWKEGRRNYNDEDALKICESLAKRESADFRRDGGIVFYSADRKGESDTPGVYWISLNNGGLLWSPTGTVDPNPEMILDFEKGNRDKFDRIIDRNRPFSE